MLWRPETHRDGCVWEPLQHLVGSPLGRFEFPGVDESEHGIGRGIQLFVAVKA